MTPGQAREFDEMLEDWKGSITTESTSVSLDEDAKDRLEELGYIK